MKLTLERQISLAFIIVLALLVTLGFFAYRSTMKLNEALRWEKHTQEVLLQLDEMLTTAIDAETGARGFIITGNDSFLDSYNRAEQNVGGNLQRLRELINDNPHQTERFVRLQDLINQKFGILKKLIQMRRTQSLAAAAEADKGQGKAVMDEIRALVGELKTEETGLLKIRETELDSSLSSIYRVLFLGTLVGIVSLGLANFAIFRETKKRSLAENSLKDANRNLEKRVEARTLELEKSNNDLKTEIQKREQSENVLRESQNRLALAMEAGRAGSFEWDVKNDAIEWSPEMEKMYGIAVGTFEGSFEAWAKRVEPEDVEIIEAEIKSALENKLDYYAYEFRAILPDGTRRWLAGRAFFEYDAGGEARRMVGINVDINEIKQAEAEREELLKRERAARKDAEVANRLRDEFLATVSHELRAPLNSILGWSRLMQQGKLDENTTPKAIETIVRNAEAQNRLIEDLLDVSRIISGKLRLEVMTVKPTNVVESALETVRPAAEAKNIKLEVKEDAEISHISGDPNRLQQVIWNLLSNAIKFTPNDGRVRVEIERSDSNVEIRVRDTGVGIKEEFLPHVFDRFSQADTSSIRKFGGLGLGLAIVRHLTEMHGGTVYAESAGENKGSTFVVKLPLVISPPETDESPNEIQTDKYKAAAGLSLDGLLILVVDDEEDTRQLLVQSLTNYGATVITASSAEAALDAIQTQKPDVLVSDIGMPDEDGYSLIRRVRQLENHIPAIALTAFTRAQDRMRSLGAGFQNHVSKPVEPDELATVVASLTGRLQMNVEE